jgi:hypothetical protein
MPEILSGHLSQEVLVRFFANAAEKWECLQVVRHLVTGCRKCAELAGRSMGIVDSGLLASSMAPDAGIRTFAASMLEFHRLEAQSQKEDFQAPAQWSVLAGLPFLQRKVRIINTPSLQTLGLLYYLLEQSRAYLRHDLAKARDAAETAVVVGDALSEAKYSRLLVRRAKSEAHAELANAHRFAEDFLIAEEAMSTALGLAGDDYIQPETRVASIHSSLLLDVGRFEESAAIMLKVAGQFRRLGEQHKQGGALVQVAMAQRHYRPRTGARTATRALSLINTDDRHLFACARFAHIDCLNQAGQHYVAMEEFKKHRQEMSLPSPRHVAIVEFLAAQIARSTGYTKEFHRLIMKVIMDFEELDMHQEYSLAYVELMLALANRGLFGRARKVAEHCIEVFSGLSLQNDALSLWLYLRDLTNSSRQAAATTLIASAQRMMARYWKVPIPDGALPALLSAGK